MKTLSAATALALALVAPPAARAQCPSVSSLQVLVSERFEDAALASRGWYDNTSVALSTAERVPGSASSAEFRFLPGARTPVAGGANRHLFAGTERAYVSYWVKYSANWEGSNRPYHPHEFHFLTDLDSQWVGPAFTHLTTYVEQNEGTPMLGIQDGVNVDQSRIGVDLVGVTESRGVAGCNGDSDGHGPGDCYPSGGLYRNGKDWRASAQWFQDAPGPRYKSDWHFVEAYFQLNSIAAGAGVPDGRVAYWYDGVTVFDHRDVVMRTGQHPTMLFNQFLIAPYIGDGSPVDQTMWVDELTIATAGVGLLRDDSVRSLAAPMLAAVFTGTSGLSLDERGPDACAQQGEGPAPSANGSSDDDDFYVASFASGGVDADSAPDPSRPLVFYEVTAPGATLRVRRNAAGRIAITY
jgi:hypothetical protein